MGENDEVRFMLRAEIREGAEPIVACGLDLSESTIFVVTDWHAPVATPVALRLSFPTVLAPVELRARVIENRAASGPGEPAGALLAFEDASRAAAADVAAAVRKLTAATAAPRPTGAYRVLLVEDSHFIRDMFAYGMARSLRSPGAISIDHADDAECAWQRLGAAAYDLVIVDYFLPAADGASLIARIRADPRTAQLPVVAISVGGRVARHATLAAGADLYLDKPLVFRDLLHTLRVLAQRESAPGSAQRRAILVLDDSPLVLAVTRFALEAAGFEVAIADDLESFERLRGTFAPDLILVDVQMPEAFGDDVASTLRGWHGVEVPILLVSSIDEPELARRAARAAATGYVKKDAGMAALVDRCKQLIGGAA